MCKLNASRIEGQAMFPLKALMRKTKTASRYFLVMWSEKKFHLSSYLKLLMPLKNQV
jgi:hypothetical protein